MRGKIFLAGEFVVQTNFNNILMRAFVQAPVYPSWWLGGWWLGGRWLRLVAGWLVAGRRVF
jgi:hypothetical protein